MARDDDPIVGWVLSQLEFPVDDPIGFVARWIGQEDFSHDASAPGTSLIVLDSRRTIPLLRQILPQSSKEGRRVVIVAPPNGDDVPLEPLHVLEIAAETGLAVQSLRHFEPGWGLTFGPSNAEPAWARIAIGELERAGRLSAALRESDAENSELHKRLAATLDEQRRLLAEIDDAEVRGAALEDELRRLTRFEERFRVAQMQMASVSEERDRLISRVEEQRSEFQQVRTDLRNQLERLQSRRSDRELELQRRQEQLLRDRSKLRYRLAVEKWKRRRMMNRRWWVLGRLLSGVVRRPLDVGAHLTSLRKLLRPPASEPRPRLPDDVEVRHPNTSQAPTAADAPVGDSFPRPTRSVSGVGELVVAVILDEMSHASFDPECRLLSFTPESWRGVLEKQRPDFLFVESAWKGNKGSWEYQVGSYSHPESIGLPPLTELIGWCRERGIPTVFWNKEDPVHFEKFKEAAALFDIVFTTDQDRVDDYRTLPGLRAHTVKALPFAAQPRFHYPAPLDGRIDAPVFAGTFYRNRHPERRQQLEMLLDSAMDQGLVIYDRMGGRVSESFGYPDRFRQAIVGGVPYEEMVEVYRRHRVFLNTNSVVDSPTMFSRRVFELLACGTPVVSTVSRGVSDMFGGEVSVVTSAQEAHEEIDRLIHDDSYWMAVSGRGVEAVARHHLYADRLRTIAEAAGFEFPLMRQVSRAHQMHEEGRREWRLPEEPSMYVLFGEDDGPAWVGRLVEADVIGCTDDPSQAYTWVQDLPKGDFAVRNSLLASGWVPDDPIPPDATVFLIPR